MYLLDTNIVSDAKRGFAPVVKWMRSVESKTLYISVLTIGELTHGVHKLSRKDPHAAIALRTWLVGFRLNQEDRILDVNEVICEEWGRISAIRSWGDADALIAATATVYGFILVTRNARDFDDTGVALFNPWEQR